MATPMRTRRDWRITRLWQAGLLAAVIAAVLNVAVYLAARALGISFLVEPPNQDPTEVQVAGVIILTVVPLLIATLLYGALRRLTRQAFRVFLILAVVVFLLLLFPPFASARDFSTAVALILMHVIAAAAVIIALALFERSTLPGS
jgi:hypothetical protein